MKKKRLTHQEVEGLKLKFQIYNKQLHLLAWAVIVIITGIFTAVYSYDWNKGYAGICLIVLAIFNFFYANHYLKKQKEIVRKLGIEVKDKWI